MMSLYALENDRIDKTALTILKIRQPLQPGVESYDNWSLISGLIGFISTLALIPAFPVVLLIVKFLSIFHNGDEWKKLNDFMTLCEGQVESYLQVGLQSYIICVRADRQPSLIQSLSLSASILMILYSQAKAWYAAKPEENLVQDIARKMALSLVLLMPNLAVLGTGVIVVVLGSLKILTIAGYCIVGKEFFKTAY